MWWRLVICEEHVWVEGWADRGVMVRVCRNCGQTQCKIKDFAWVRCKGHADAIRELKQRSKLKQSARAWL
jgi:hypothetical protein